MDRPDVSVNAIVQAKFTSGEVVKSIHLHASIGDPGWTQENRILALVENNNSVALFILISTKVPPIAFSDLTIEKAIAVDSEFKCEIDSNNIISAEPYVVLNIISTKLSFQLEVSQGTESSTFVAEVLRAVEGASKEKKNFSWLQKYTCMRNGESTDALQNADCDDDLESPDIAVPRQKIAQGQVNVQARESLLRYQLTLKISDYTDIQEFSIFVGTWNVNGQAPTIPLSAWLSCDTDPPDVYAIGFQELDLSKETFLFNDTPREEEWQKAVASYLHPGAKYRQVALIRLVGMLLIVHVRNEMYSFVRNVSVDTVGTGIMGKMGNKGGVGVRLKLHDTTLCFVNSHLAAHTEEVERRNQDYQEICSRMNFKKPPQSIKDHDQVYWLGDLNYRITELTAKQVKDHLARGNIEAVLPVDQLVQQHIKGRVLSGYTEGDITFRPTYKYDPNTDHFDTSEKARAPAWCDRVLWKGHGITQKTYRSHPDLRISDHKPVSAVFRSEIRVIDPEKYRKTHEEVLKKLDKLENEFLPQVMVDQTEVIFDTVKFLEPQNKSIIIANTGQVPVQFEFIKKLNDSSYCKDWLRITPYSDYIKPGEKCDVRLEVQLESALEQLYDILVLHLEGGKDVFITVTGNGQRSSFTTSFSALCRAPVPILHLTPEQLAHADSGRAPILYAVPRELWQLVDHLYRHSMRTQNLFDTHALHNEVIQVRDWLDYGSTEPTPSNVHAVAEALLLLLSYTTDPVIPFRLHQNCTAVANTYASCKQIIMMKLSELERNIFLFICSFLQELLMYSSENGTDAKTLATVFGDVLLRDPIRNSRPQANRRKAEFVYHFLVNDQSQLIAMKK